MGDVKRPRGDRDGLVARTAARLPRRSPATRQGQRVTVSQTTTSIVLRRCASFWQLLQPHLLGIRSDRSYHHKFVQIAPKHSRRVDRRGEIKPKRVKLPPHRHASTPPCTDLDPASATSQSTQSLPQARAALCPATCSSSLR